MVKHVIGLCLGNHKNRILEVGCGTGLGGLLFSQITETQPFIYYATDYAPNMLSLAYSRFEKKQLLSTPSLEVTHTPSLPTEKITLPEELPAKSQLHLLRANGMDLPFVDESFESYFSSIVVHIVPNPQKMIQEAYRVLKPNGIAAFGAWGRKQKSIFFTLLPKILIQNGIEIPDTAGAKSKFMLGGEGDEKIREYVANAGFKDVKIHYKDTEINILNMDVLWWFFAHDEPFSSILKKAGEEKTQEIKKQFCDTGEQYMKENSKFISFENVIFTCYK